MAAVVAVSVGVVGGVVAGSITPPAMARQQGLPSEPPPPERPTSELAEPPAAESEVDTTPPAAAAGTVPVAPPVVAIANVRTASGRVLPAISSPAPGRYDVVTPCAGRAVVAASPIASVMVVLDPGHGGSETGAVGPNGLEEKRLNLAVSQRVFATLRAAGISVLLTRVDDTRTSLASRALLAKGAKARAFVSIHHNAGAEGVSPAPGTEEYAQVDDPAAATLAELVNAEVRAAVAPFATEWSSNSLTGVKARRGTAGDDYYGVLRRAKGVPSVISEALFIDRPAEADLLARADVQQAEADAIARAITKFVATAKPSSSSTPVEAPTPTPGCVDGPL